MRARTARLIATSALAAGVLIATAAPVSADHHFVKISEVLPTSTMNPDAEFVELQMYADGQNNFISMAHTGQLVFYNSLGVTGSADFTMDPTGGNQRTVLAATMQAVTDLSLAATDLTYANGDFLDNPEGAVCFTSGVFPNIDCAAYGTYNNMTNGLPGIGTPESAPAAGSSITRSIAPGCPTLLEQADDTGDNATDFFIDATPSPRPSATAPTEVACAPAGGGSTTTPVTPTSSPPKKCKKGQKLKKGRCVKKKKKKRK